MKDNKGKLGFLPLSIRTERNGRKKRNRTARLQGIETADMVHEALLWNLKVR